MATVIPTTNVALTDLETAPGGATPSNFDFATSGRREWSVGIQGSQAFGLFTWGYGNGTGSTLNPIFGLTPPAGVGAPLELGDWRGLQYWFDGTTFNITNKVNNSLPFNPPADFLDFQIVITDSTGDFSIFSQSPNSPPDYFFSFTTFGGINDPEQQIPGFQPDQFVLARYLYWKMEINAGPDFPGGTVDFQINGVQVFIEFFPPGPFNETRDWTNGTFGETVGSGIQMLFDITP